MALGLRAVSAVIVFGFLLSTSVSAQDGTALPIKAQTGETIRLDPTDSVDLGQGGLILSWEWIQRPAISVADFSDPNALRPLVTLDAAGTYQAKISFLDGANLPVASSVITFGSDNLAPVAQLRARGVPDGASPLVVDGSASFDLEGEGLTYGWSVGCAPAGSNAAISGSGPTVQFSMDLEGEYCVSLSVQDEAGLSSVPEELRVSYLPNGGSTDVFRLNFDDVQASVTGAPDVFDLGERQTAAGGHDRISGFELGTDMLQLTLDSVVHQASTASEILALVDVLELDADAATNVRMSPNEAQSALTFIFAGAGGSVTLEGVIGTELTRVDLEQHGVDFYEGVGGRRVAPIADGRFDQLGVVAGGTLVLEPYASSDIDGDVLVSQAVVAVAPDGSAPVLSTDIDGQSTLMPDVAGDYLVAVQVSDGLHSHEDQVLVVTRQDANLRPVARIAAVTDTFVGTRAIVDGTQSYDLNGDLINHSWALLSAPAGSAAVLDEERSGFIGLTPDLPGDYVVQLIVADAEVAGVPTTTLIRVSPPLPVADAGPDRLAGDLGQLTLDGTLSSGGAVGYHWSALGLTGDGSVPNITGNNDAFPAISLDIREGRFRDVIRLASVYHLKRAEKSGLCQFDTRLPGDLPDTSAGDQIFVTLHSRGKQDTMQGTIRVWEIENKKDHTRVVTLEESDGTQHGSFIVPGRVSVHVTTTDIGKNTRLYAVVDGTSRDNDRAKNNPFNRNNPVCTGPGAGVIQLIVADGAGASVADTMFIGNANLRPVLTTGPRFELVSGETVDLIAADYGADGNGDTLGYGWSLISRPDNSQATIGTSAVVPGDAINFAPDKVGVYLIQISADDGAMQAVPAVIEVEVINSPPIAAVAPVVDTFVGEVATLDGTGSFDPDGDALTYQWTLVSAPAGSVAMLGGADQPVASFAPDRRGDYVFSLVVSDYEFDSPAVTVTLTAPNRPPLAVFDGPEEVNVDEEIIYTAAASSDPDNDPLSFVYGVVSKPSGSDPFLADLGNGEAGFVADVPGEYVLRAEVSDGLLSASAEVTVTALAGNRPPVLGAINPLYTVELGLELALDLTGTDPDADPISFFATPLPLANGITLSAADGAVRFRPETGQLGTYSFTVGVSDGSLTDEAVLNIEVVAATAGDTGVFGRVLDAKDFAQGVITPLANMPVRLRDAALMATTAADGSFDFGSLTAGGDQVIIEPSAAGGPGGYLGTARTITITENQNRDLDPDFLLVPLDEGCAPVIAGQETVLTSAISGVSVTIPADSVQDSGGAAYTGDVCLGSLPDMFQHPGFGEDTRACRIFALDAPGAVFTQGLTVSAPNLDNLPEQTSLEMWRLSSDSGLFRRIAGAGVDAGAATVSGQATNFQMGSLFTFLPQMPRTEVSADQPTGMRGLTPFLGDNSMQYTLPGYTSFGETQDVGFSYHSQAANPTIMVAGDVTIANDASLPVSLQSRIDIGGLSISETAHWTPRTRLDGYTPALVGEEVSLNQSTAVDGSGLDSGRYGYRFIAKAQYDCSTVSGSHRAELYVQNESQSPYGNGWSITGLQQLIVSPDGSISIVDDSSVTPFNREPTLTEFEDEPLVFPTIGTIGVGTGDWDLDGDIDVTYAESGTGSIGFLSNLGDGEIIQESPLQVADPNNVPQTGRYPPNLAGLAVGELTNDGTLDVAWVTQDQRSYGYAENDGLGNFFPGFDSGNTGRRALDVKVGDIDGDGFEDIIYGANAGFFIFIDDEIWVSYGGPTGRTLNRISRRGFSGRGTLQVMLGDVDGNGHLDVAYRTREGVDFVFNNGNRNYTLQTLRAGNGGFNVLGNFAQLADFNGDGLLDLVYSTTNDLQILLNTTGRAFAAPAFLPRPPSAGDAMPVNLADANGDGAADIIATAGGEIHVYKSQGNGDFAPFETGLVSYPIDKVAIADINDDGSLDLASIQRFTVTVHYSKPSDTGRFISGDGDFSNLERLPDGTWRRRYKDGTIIEYDANGLQTAVVDTQGNRKEYAYGPDGRLESITDQVGGITAFTYDANGRVASITYPDGRVSSFDYDDIGNLNEITEPAGSKVSFTYDENGRLVSSTNQNGNTTGYEYDAVGNLSGASLPDGSSVANQVASSLGLIDGLGGPATQPLIYVEPEDRITTVTDRKGQVTEVVVNQFGSTVQITDPLGRVTRIERDEENLAVRVERPSDAIAGGVRVDTIAYDFNGNVTNLTEAVGTAEERSTGYKYEPTFSNVIEMTDADGFTTVYEYDAFGEATKVIDPEGGERLFSYETDGKLASRSDENGNPTTFTYNALRNLDTITYADGSITAMTYDATGNATVIAEAAGTVNESQVQRTYDALNRVLTVEITGSDGVQINGLTSYAYLPAGNLASVTDETGLVTSMGYDALERLTSVDDPAEGLISRVFNEAGEVVSHINGDGETHGFVYDNVSRLTQTTDPEGFVKSFSYDSRDNIQTVTDGRGGVTAFGYDGLDRMTTRTNPIGETMTRSYDGRDNLAELVREDGALERAIYDGLGRRIEVQTPGNTLLYSYDPRGNLTSAADDDSRVTFTYDARNRLETTSTDGTIGLQPAVTLTYTYDELDRRMSMSDSLGGTTGYAYDPERRLTELTAPWGTVYSFGYDGEGRRTSLTSTSGRVSSYGYTNGLLTALSHAQSGVSLTDLTYEYGPDGQLTAIVDNLDTSKSKFISYDDLNRLIQVDVGVPAGQGGTPLPVEDYAYDEEGNRTASHLSALYLSNDHNQLLEDDNYTYAYDEKGNRISKTDKTTGDVETYAYDSQNRLVGYSNPNLTARYAYDALDRRIAKTIDDPGLSIDPPAKPDPQALRLNRQPGVDVPDLVLKGEFTVEGWVKFEAGEPIDNRDVTFASGPGQPTQNINFYLARMRLYAPDAPGPNDLIIANTVASDQGVWTHYAMTRDAGGTLRIYVNGAEDVVGTNPFTEPFHIGFLAGIGGGTSEADFADFRVWSVARSQGQINTFKSARLDETTANLERLFRFEGSATDVLDATGNSASAPIPAGGAIVASPDAPVASPPAAAPPQGPNAEVRAYVYDMSTYVPLSHDDIALEFDASGPGVISKRWLHSNRSDEPIAYEHYSASSGPGSGTENLLLADRQGSIMQVVEASTSTIVAAYEYSGFGETVQTVGGVKQLYGYNGREYDEENQLYHLRHRSYDPQTGSFLQTDPIEFGSGTLNLHGYVSNNPFNYTDPWGLSETAQFGIGTSLTAAEAMGTGFAIGTAAILLAGQINAALRDLSKIHVAPGTALNNPPEEGGSAPPPPPPGDCTKKQLKRMQDAKNRADARARSCHGNDSLGTLFWNRAALEELKFRRAVIMATCFRGGDSGHKKALAQVQTRIDNCNGIIATRVSGHAN